MLTVSVAHRYGPAVIAATAAVALTACGAENQLSPLTDAGVDSAERPRSSRQPRDAYIPPPPPDGELPTGCSAMGTACEDDGDCCSPLTCIELQTGLKACTRGCRNDLAWTKLVDEDDCPSGSRCLQPPGDVVCAPLCEPALGGSSCPDGSACHPASAALLGINDKAACAFPACNADADCPVMLAETCIVGAAEGSADTCARVGPEAFCVAGPAATGSASPSRYGRCALPGKCDLPSGLCLAHDHGDKLATVGAPCGDDRDCGGQMRCLREERLTPQRARWRGGYCVVEGCAFAGKLPHRTCPAGSDCFHYHPGGRCLKTCDPLSASGCRGVAGDGYGDYECYAWNRYWLTSSQRISNKPLCDTPDQPIYRYFAQQPQLSCAALGAESNPTSMTCRDPLTGKPASPQVSDCLCLDTSTSGPMPPDA